MELNPRVVDAVIVRDSAFKPRSTPLAGWAGAALPALILFALWLMATLGLRPLLLPDEGRYATVALEMLQGNALVPTLNGLPFFHKPPLF